MGTPLCSLPQSIPPPVPPFFPPPLFLLLPSTLIALHFILSSHHHSYKCSICLPILPAFSQPTSILSYQTQRGWGFFFFFFYNLLDDNGKRHTTYCIIPASRYYTWQQWAHISVQNIQYDWLYWDKYSSKTQNESSVVWCFTRRGPLFFSSNTSIV